MGVSRRDLNWSTPKPNEPDIEHTSGHTATMNALGKSRFDSEFARTGSSGVPRQLRIVDPKTHEENCIGASWVLETLGEELSTNTALSQSHGGRRGGAIHRDHLLEDAMQTRCWELAVRAGMYCPRRNLEIGALFVLTFSNDAR